MQEFTIRRGYPLGERRAFAIDLKGRCYREDLSMSLFRPTPAEQLAKQYNLPWEEVRGLGVAGDFTTAGTLTGRTPSTPEAVRKRDELRVLWRNVLHDDMLVQARNTLTDPEMGLYLVRDFAQKMLRGLTQQARGENNLAWLTHLACCRLCARIDTPEEGGASHLFLSVYAPLAASFTPQEVHKIEKAICLVRDAGTVAYNIDGTLPADHREGYWDIVESRNDGNDIAALVREIHTILKFAYPERP